MLDVICAFCGAAIQPSSDPMRPVHRVARATWAHHICWLIRKPEPMDQVDHYQEEQMVMELTDE